MKVSESSRPPFSRVPAGEGELVLVGRTYVPKEDDTYTSRWHLVRWKRHKDRPWTFVKRNDAVPWWRGNPFERIQRWWAYVARCGAGKAWPIRQIKYGAPTCKRCLRKLT